MRSNLPLALALALVLALVLVPTPETEAQSTCASNCAQQYFNCIADANQAWVICAAGQPAHVCNAALGFATFQCSVTENQCLQGCGSSGGGVIGPDPIPGTPQCASICFDRYAACVASGTAEQKCLEQLEDCVEFCGTTFNGG